MAHQGLKIILSDGELVGIGSVVRRPSWLSLEESHHFGITLENMGACLKNYSIIVTLNTEIQVSQ